MLLVDLELCLCFNGLIPSLCLFLVFLFETNLLTITDMNIAHWKHYPFFNGLKTLSAYIHFYAFHILVVWHDTMSLIPQADFLGLMLCPWLLNIVYWYRC